MSHRSSFLVTAPANRLIEDEQFVYTYDADGNVTTKAIKATGKEWRYTYDAYDRLTSAGRYPDAVSTTAEENELYVHDALNRRVQRRAQLPQGGAIFENYFHDGWDIDSADERSCCFPTTLTRRAWFTMGDTDDRFSVARLRQDTMTMWSRADAMWASEAPT